MTWRTRRPRPTEEPRFAFRDNGKVLTYQICFERTSQTVTINVNEPASPMAQRRQFSLRMIFLAITLCAMVLLVWRNRPAPTLQLDLTAEGTALVDGEEVELSLLGDRIHREARYRKIWLMEPVLILRSSPVVSQQELAEVATLSQKAGFAKLALTVDER